MLPQGCVEKCPGCRYRGLSSPESDARKQAWAERWLGPARPIRTSSSRLGYRRKTLLHAGKGSEGWELGLLKRRGWDAELVAIPDCPAHSPELNASLAALRALLPADLPLAFVQASGPLLTLVLKCRPEERWRAWARGTEPALREAGVAGLQLNWHPSAGRKPLSSRHQEPIFGERFVNSGSGYHGALSFRQQIAELENEALALALAFFRIYGALRVVDLYCGTGASLALWEEQGWRACGVELTGEAVEAAKLNAPLSLVLKGKVEHRLPQLDSFLAESPAESFLAYTNPPREGMGREVCDWLRQKGPVAIAYLSCNPKSLAADLARLGNFYRLVETQPFDFFPQTDHVEALALLERRSP